MQTDSDRKKRKFWKVCRASLVSLLVGLILLELLFRFLVLSDRPVAKRLGAGLRHAEWYADGDADDDYWKLLWYFAEPDQRDKATNFDPICGWTGYAVVPRTYAITFSPEPAGRTPILLYGDSFAACNTTTEQCFQSLWESTDMAQRYALINYGVGGYGTDQIYLLLKNSIDRWKDQNPIVVVGLLVDSDFDRSVLSFRGCVKPRFVLDGDRFEVEGPVAPDTETFLAQRPLRIRSLVWRDLVYGPSFLPKAWQKWLHDHLDRRAEKIAVNRRILDEIHRELESRHLRHFFLMFHGEVGVRREPTHQWAEDLLIEEAGKLGVPVMPTRPFLVAAGGGDPEAAMRFFGGSPQTAGHYNEIGNRIVLQAIRAGVEGRFDPPDVSRVEEMLARGELGRSYGKLFGFESGILSRGEGGLVRVSTQPYPPFEPSGAGGAGGSDGNATLPPYLVMRPSRGGPTEVELRLDGKAKRLRGRACAVHGETAGADAGALRLIVRVDGRNVVEGAAPGHPDGIVLDVDLAGARKLDLVVEGPTEHAIAAWVHIADVRIE
jgi:hypothetical protein